LGQRGKTPLLGLSFMLQASNRFVKAGDKTKSGGKYRLAHILEILKPAFDNSV